MRAVIGTLGDLTCSQDPGVLALDAATVQQIQTVTTSWSACVDHDKGYAAVIFQTTGTPGRDIMWPFVKQQFTSARTGRWSSVHNTGPYSAGMTTANSAMVGWEDDKLPVLAFIGATKTGTVDEVVQYWTKALGATITG